MKKNKKLGIKTKKRINRGKRSRTLSRVSQMGSTGRGNLGKMAKNCMKLTKSTFLGQNSGGHGGDKPIFRVVWGSPQSPLPLGETLLSEVKPVKNITKNPQFSRDMSQAKESPSFT